MPVSFHFYPNKEINQSDNSSLSDYFRTGRLSNNRGKQFERQPTQGITCRKPLSVPEGVKSVHVQVRRNAAVFFILEAQSVRNGRLLPNFHETLENILFAGVS